MNLLILTGANRMLSYFLEKRIGFPLGRARRWLPLGRVRRRQSNDPPTDRQHAPSLAFFRKKTDRFSTVVFGVPRYPVERTLGDPGFEEKFAKTKPIKPRRRA